MNNTSLNREFTQAMRDKNKAKGKTGFTDSEDDDDNSYSRCKLLFSIKMWGLYTLLAYDLFMIFQLIVKFIQI